MSRSAAIVCNRQVYERRYSRNGARTAVIERNGRVKYLIALTRHGRVIERTTYTRATSLAAARQIAQKWTRA